ncbi:Holliday junction branch migration protein RuvA [Ruficoccus amylovorans]|uniref:Holliday junction branch migration complex subunit RuvA n=1 Tax=Ruficoccus amylovorans TaxID=1804625 RepID=A0A842HF20_9BACT|nr:Holliday junction branch migration protein RuvA [Ruficoccus amylovorans]MBC2594859.1 Holliday junction branch migration protein RuvA [Ruficoccus amylovorans]
MIVSLEGKLVEAAPLSAVIEANGIGYEVFIPVTTAEKLPGIGQTARLHTLAVYREDSQTLYGFATREDRDFFRLLVEKVSGIGPKIALNIMSRMSVASLRTAIAHSDIALLSKCQGIGKKTAERLVIELRDKVFPGGIPAAAPSAEGTGTEGILVGGSSFQDALAALVTLGYKPPEADKALRKAQDKLGPDASTEALIKTALG